MPTMSGVVRGNTPRMVRWCFLLSTLLVISACSEPIRNVIGVDTPATPAATVEGTTLRTVYDSTTGKRSADNLAKLSVTVIDLTEVEDPTTLNHNKFASA